MKKIKFILCSLILVFFLTSCSEFTAITPLTSENILEVHFLDVGQADATLITTGNSSMLIDGGNEDDGKFILNYIKNLGISNLDYVINTHAHEDHIGGLPFIAKNLRIDTVIASNNYENSVSDSFFQIVDEHSILLQEPEIGKQYILGDAVFQILGPLKTEYSDYNDNSVALKFVHGNNSFLFTGDACYEGERDIISTGIDLSADVYKAGHHGSSTSSSPSLLNKVQPAYAVISCGEDNSYGHPHRETLQSFKSRNIEYFRTDELGTVICESDGENLVFYSDGEHLNADNTAESTSETVYIGNKKSKKVHLSDCSSLPSENNSVYFSSLEEALNLGYSPCNGCNPY